MHIGFSLQEGHFRSGGFINENHPCKGKLKGRQICGQSCGSKYCVLVNYTQASVRRVCSKCIEFLFRSWFIKCSKGPLWTSKPNKHATCRREICKSLIYIFLCKCEKTFQAFSRLTVASIAGKTNKIEKTKTTEITVFVIHTKWSPRRHVCMSTCRIFALRSFLTMISVKSYAFTFFVIYAFELTRIAIASTPSAMFYRFKNCIIRYTFTFMSEILYFVCPKSQLSAYVLPPTEQPRIRWI